MNNDIRYSRKLMLSILILVALPWLGASGQPVNGTLKIFSEDPLVVYVDDVHYPRYDEIKLVPGTHWVKAINSEGARVYSQIVTVRADEVTSLLIEVSQAPANTPGPGSGQPQQAQTPAPATGPGRNAQTQTRSEQNPASQTGVTFSRTGVSSENSQSGLPGQAGEPAGKAATGSSVPEYPKPTIEIGQVNGTLPADMGGAFGLTFGMNIGEVDRIMSPKAAQTQRNSDYYVYAIPTGSSLCIVECRFLDQKLFQIIVGYLSTYNTNSKIKMNKGEVPVPEFNQMLNDVSAIYGSPATAEKIFLAGYSEDDGRLLEALKKKKALYLYTWTETETGNNVMVVLAYTNAPLAGTVYTSGPLSKEAAKRKVRLHAYDFNKSFKDNYFSN